MNYLLLMLYRIFVVPPSAMFLPLLAVFSKKVAEGVRLRRVQEASLPANSPRPIWIHASSGEFEYAKSVIRELKSRTPEIPILVTYFSPTFAKAVSSFAGVDVALALPLDLPGPTRSFLTEYRPRLFLIERTDLWPEMLEQCRRREIPILLFSYTQKEFSSALKRSFTAWTLHWVQHIYCVSQQDSLNLRSLPVKAEALGDTRYDQVAYRLRHGKVLPEILRPPTGRPCLVAGSTWPEDEAALLGATAEFVRAGRLTLILVPHEPTPEHIAQLESVVRAAGLAFAKFSEDKAWTQVLIVDRVGVLAELYAWGELAFVGGSFRKSVHSVMEALGASCLTFVGPKHLNNREALEFKALAIGGRHGLEVAKDSADFKLKLKQILDHPQTLAPFREALKTEFNRRLGATQKLVDRLSPHLF